MEIKGIAHCFFEQSGTFKKEFKKLGIHSFDYDIQNNYGETDFCVNLFTEIDNAYKGGRTLFDKIDSENDLIFAFYPCVYFCQPSQMAFHMNCINYKNLHDYEKIDKILCRQVKREEYYERLLKFVYICLKKKLRLIIENPWSEQTFLKYNFIKPPDFIDHNRRIRGDYFKKPTAYWFWNCHPELGITTIQNDKPKKTIMSQKKSYLSGFCSTERSAITADYARNLVNDIILGQQQKKFMYQGDLFTPLQRSK